MSAENYESLQDHEERIKKLEQKVRDLELKFFSLESNARRRIRILE